MRGHPPGFRARRATWLVLAGLLAGRTTAAVEVTGRLGHWSVGGYAEGYAVVPVNPDSQRQLPEGILDLRVTGDLHPKARLYLETRAIAGGPVEHADGPGFVNLSDTFQNISPELEIPEGYVDLFLPSLDVRIGKQKFAWGRLDTYQPTDVLNPRRFTDPFITEEQDAKIGVPALRASYYLPELGSRLPTDTSFTLVWVPVPVPVRFPEPGERWFPPAVNTLRVIDVRASLLRPGLPDFRVDTHLRAKNVRPPQQLDEGAVAFRLAGLYQGVDWALYYYDGPETRPAFALDASVSHLGPCSPPVAGTACVRGDTTLRPVFGRIRLVGGDAAYELHGITARVEAAYGTDRLLPRRARDLTSLENLGERLPPQLDRILGRLGMGKRAGVNLGPLFVPRDTVEWGAGVDYRWHGWMPLLQVNQTLILDNAGPTLLINDVDSRLFFVVRKSFLADRLATEAGVVQELERGYTLGISRFTYAITDSWRVRVGYLLLAGTDRSLVGQFHDNDEAFFQVRYSY